MVEEENNNSTENLEEEDDLEAQMAATVAAEGLADSIDEENLEAQLAAAIDAETDDTEDDLEAQMAAAMGEGEGEGEDDGIDESLLDELVGEGAGAESGLGVQPVQFQQLRPTDEQGAKDNVDRLMDVVLSLSVELGRKQMQIKEILDLGPGKIIELDKLAGEPVDLLVNGRMLAKGEVVVVDENFGVRITDLVTPKDRIRSL